MGEAVELHTELQLREDGMTLYGFPDPADRTWFRLLQTVQGVGAGGAVAPGDLAAHELANAIAAGDKAMLARASGVGGRLAARIASELKDRVGALPQPGAAADRCDLGGAAEGDALSALLHLGYARAEAYAALARVQARLGSEVAVDVLVREGLKELTRERADREPGRGPEDGDVSLRPRRLAEFIGQAQLRANLGVFIEAAGTRGDALDHVLFAGPPGLGKTTLAQIVAAELGVGFRTTSGPIISARATSPRSSPTCSRATCCSSTRSTACSRWSRKSSIRRWRTTSST